MGEGTAPRPTSDGIARSVRLLVAADSVLATFRRRVLREFLPRYVGHLRKSDAWHEAHKQAMADGADPASLPPQPPDACDEARERWLPSDYALLAANHDYRKCDGGPHSDSPIIDSDRIHAAFSMEDAPLAVVAWGMLRLGMVEVPESPDALAQQLEAALERVSHDLAAQSDPPRTVIREAFRRVARAFEIVRSDWIEGDGKHAELLSTGCPPATSGYVAIVRGEIRADVDRLLGKLQHDADFVPFILPHCDPSLRDNITRVLRLLDLDSSQSDRYGEVTERWRQSWPAMALDADIDELGMKLRAAGDAVVLTVAAAGPARSPMANRQPQPTVIDPAPDRTESDALAALAGREVWAADELPVDIDADILRRLDVRGWVQARGVVMDHGNPDAPVRRPLEWHSPTERADNNGGNCGWDALLANRARTKWKHPYEVRVTERGRAARAKVGGAIGGPFVDAANFDAIAERAAAKLVEAMEPRDDGIGGGNTDWEEVQGRLLVKRERGEPYTSLRKLGAEFECSGATIRKAIDESETLRGWQARTTGPKAAPKATDLGAVARDPTPQTREPAPSDVLSADEIETTMARLIDQAKPDERATLNAMGDSERRALVAAYQAQNLDDEPSPLEADKPGQRRRKVKHHKRA